MHNAVQTISSNFSVGDASGLLVAINNTKFNVQPTSNFSLHESDLLSLLEVMKNVVMESEISASGME